MATTVNGHKVITSSRTDGPHPRLRKWNVPGTNRHFLLRDGAMGFILVHFIMWFDRKIAPIDRGQWDEWGWAVRPVRGQRSGYSNHAGGAAADINATKHPIGVSIWKTFTGRQIRAIRFWIRRRIYRGVLVWGGDWSRPDGMHIEIGRVSLRRCEKVARRLMKTKRGRKILRANPGAKKAILS